MNMAISTLPDEMLLHILQYLDIQDKIAFAYTCNRFRQIAHLNRRSFRKIDLSGCVVRREQRAIKEFIRDKKMAQHIRELNISNHRIQNFQMDIDLEEFIIASCHQLEALHVMHSGMSLKSIHRVLQYAPKLTTLSFSIMDLFQQDIDFIVQKGEVANDFFLEKVKYLRIQILLSAIHLRILKYLVLFCCKHLKELEIYIWDLPDTSEHETHKIKIDPGFLPQWPQPRTRPLNHFDSLTVQIVNFCNPSRCNLIMARIPDFIASVSKMKSPEIKWKKFWISPPIDSILQNNSALVQLDSVEAFSANCAFNEEDEVKTLFEIINDGVVRKLQLHNIEFFNQICGLIARIGGQVLQSFSLSRICEFYNVVDFDANLNKLFSTSANIREIDLTGCHFQKSICESLSKLKHLAKVQLPQCAIAPNCTKERVNGKLWTFVENCRDVIEFFVRGCYNRRDSSRFIVSDDLLPIAKWTKLESLTCVDISITTPQCNRTLIYPKQLNNTFLKNIIQDCKFLTMLRISIVEYDQSYFNIFNSAEFMKHLSIEVREVDLGEADIWKGLSCASNLERLCIRSSFKGSLNVEGAVEMLKSLLRLHLLHVHFSSIDNLETFVKHVMRTLEDEKSDRMHCFEFLMQEEGYFPKQLWTSRKVLPLNRCELCYVMPSMALPRV